MLRWLWWQCCCCTTLFFTRGDTNALLQYHVCPRPQGLLAAQCADPWVLIFSEEAYPGLNWIFLSPSTEGEKSYHFTLKVNRMTGKDTRHWNKPVDLLQWGCQHTTTTTHKERRSHLLRRRLVPRPLTATNVRRSYHCFRLCKSSHFLQPSSRCSFG